MRKIVLIPEIKASVIGFGCAPIMGSVDAKTSKHALDMAMELGINYFDVARSYGYGEAEGFLGKIIKDRKNEVYVATKFGIVPNWKAGMLNQLKPVVRYLKELKQNSMNPAKIKAAKASEIANRFLDRVEPLRAEDMRKSLEKSLRELNREYVDFLFIHEPHHSLDHIDELLASAEILKKEGKLRGFGLAAMHSQESFHKSYINKFDILQYENPMIRTDYDDFVQKNKGKPSVIFSPFHGGLSTMSPSEKLSRLFKDFPKSVVLCSMFNPDHIKQNIQLAKSLKD